MIELAPHQRSATDRVLTLLDQFGGAILADDVGLGKSFVAANVARQIGQSIEVIVPASLVAQWRRTLDDFGVAARVITHDSLLRDPFVAQPRRDRLLIVDEAHAFRNPATQRHAALARRTIAAKLLLVTATPICNSPDDLLALLTLIVSDDALRSQGIASIEDAFRARDALAIRTILSVLVIRRGREILAEPMRFGTVVRRVIRHPVLDARGIGELRFPLIGAGRHDQLLRRFLWRRLESSEAALLESIRRQRRFYERALDCLRSGRALTKRDYRRAFGGEEERDAMQEVLFWEVFASETSRIDAAEIRSEMRQLDALRAEASSAPAQKRALFQSIVRETREPLLVFTGAIATARDLAGSIRNAGLLTSHDARPQDALEAFRNGRIDVLVCTDLASEGLNLQRAGVVVHYDIPWNPVKVDQRNGRASRIGQTREQVEAIYFVPSNRRTHIVETMALKNRLRRRLLETISTAETKPTSVIALPVRLSGDAAAVALIRQLRSRGLAVPPQLACRYRAGIERLFDEMAHEFIDPPRLDALLELIGADRGTLV